MRLVLNPDEAPSGFYAILKKDLYSPTATDFPNICEKCDARLLCQENVDDWCLKNYCMGYEVQSIKDGKIYQRKDKCSVIFKRKAKGE